MTEEQWPWKTVRETKGAVLRELRNRCYSRLLQSGGEMQATTLAEQVGLASRTIRPILSGDDRFSFIISMSIDRVSDGRRHERLTVRVAELFDAPKLELPDISSLPVFRHG